MPTVLASDLDADQIAILQLFRRTGKSALTIREIEKDRAGQTPWFRRYLQDHHPKKTDTLTPEDISGSELRTETLNESIRKILQYVDDETVDWTGREKFFNDRLNEVYLVSIDIDDIEDAFGHFGPEAQTYLQRYSQYAEQSGHPYVPEEITIGWVRYTTLDDGTIWVDEVQTDLQWILGMRLIQQRDYQAALRQGDMRSKEANYYIRDRIKERQTDLDREVIGVEWFILRRFMQGQQAEGAPKIVMPTVEYRQANYPRDAFGDIAAPVTIYNDYPRRMRFAKQDARTVDPSIPAGPVWVFASVVANLLDAAQILCQDAEYAEADAGNESARAGVQDPGGDGAALRPVADGRSHRPAGQRRVPLPALPVAGAGLRDDARAADGRARHQADHDGGGDLRAGAGLRRGRPDGGRENPRDEGARRDAGGPRSGREGTAGGRGDGAQEDCVLAEILVRSARYLLDNSKPLWQDVHHDHFHQGKHDRGGAEVLHGNLEEEPHPGTESVGSSDGRGVREGPRGNGRSDGRRRRVEAQPPTRWTPEQQRALEEQWRRDMGEPEPPQQVQAPEPPPSNAFDYQLQRSDSAAKNFSRLASHYKKQVCRAVIRLQEFAGRPPGIKLTQLKGSDDRWPCFRVWAGKDHRITYYIDPPGMPNTIMVRSIVGKKDIDYDVEKSGKVPNGTPWNAVEELAGLIGTTEASIAFIEKTIRALESLAFPVHRRRAYREERRQQHIRDVVQNPNSTKESLDSVEDQTGLDPVKDREKLLAFAHVLAGLAVADMRAVNMFQMQLADLMGMDPMDWVAKYAAKFRSLYEHAPLLRQAIDDGKVTETFTKRVVDVLKRAGSGISRISGLT